MKEIFLYIGSSVIVLWGASHIVIPTKGVIESFGQITIDSKRILAMEWIMEGLTLIFIGLLVIIVTILEGVGGTSIVVYRASAIMLIIMALVSMFTGARTKILPMKLCPPIFMTVAVIYFIGSV